MHKKIFCVLVLLFFTAIFFHITESEAKKPLIAKGGVDVVCGVIMGGGKTIVLNVIDERTDKIEIDQDVLAHLRAMAEENLKSCGYSIVVKPDAGTKKIELQLNELWVDKEAGKVASRMEARAGVKAVVSLGDVELYNTQLTALSSRTQPFVGRVIKKGKWAINLMEELAADVASDSPLNAELSK